MKDTTPNSADVQSVKSRSQKKRESTALQKLGEELSTLTPAIWKKLPLPPELELALSDYKDLKTHEARRRQMQFIGRLMREMDDEERDQLCGAIDDIRDGSLHDKRMQHQLEELREALLSPIEVDRQTAFSKALTVCPAVAEARLRHLVENALADREKKRPPKHARELFRYLRDGMCNLTDS